jgi:hypothetical protein
MIAISLLYLQSKFTFADMNTCASVVLRADVSFVTASRKWRRIVSSKCYAIKFSVKLEEGAVFTCGKIQEEFGNDSASRAKVFQW